MYKLKYKGQEIDELLEQVDEKTIYDNATVEKAGLMSSKDKKKLEEFDIQVIPNQKIQDIINRYG